MEVSPDVIVAGRRLGRRAPKNAPAIRLSSILKTVPSHPVIVDYLSSVTDYNIYGNDTFGDCGPVSVANSLKIITSLGDSSESSVTLEDVFALYKLVNPDFDPNTGAGDNGVDMQTMLELLLKHGIGGRKPVAFARVDASNLDEVCAAVAYFGCSLFGVDLEIAQQTQTDKREWSYSPSGEWGGHAICAGAYNVTEIEVVTWAERVKADVSFVQHQLQEAWVVVWPEHLTHPAFLAGVDVDALAAAYKAVTGKVMPVPAPGPAPVPGPVPVPVPVPGAAPFPGASDAVSHHILSAAHRAGEDVSVWLNRHFDTYFKISE